MRVTKDLQPNIGLINTIRNINRLKNTSNTINVPNTETQEKNRTIILQKTSLNNNNPIKVKLVKSNQNQSQTQQSFNDYNKLQMSPKRKNQIDHIYKDQVPNMKNKNKLCNSSSKILDNDLNLNNNHINMINQTDINKLRHSLIYANEKNIQKEKEESTKNTRKYISMSPKLTLRYKDENENKNNDLDNKVINRGFVIQKNVNEENNKEEIDNSDNKTSDGGQKQNEHKIRNLLSKNFPYNKKKPSNKLGGSYSIMNKKTWDENKMSNKNNNAMINSPRTVAGFMNNDLDNNIRNSQQNRYYKVSVSPSRNFGMNRTSYNYYNTNISQNNNNNNKIGFNNDITNNLEIKLEDLIMLEERLNDICISLNNNNNINDVGASNECIEFFVFYFHSSLTYKFPLLFQESKRILIQSAINLKLFTIVMTYHLSMNIRMLSDVLLYLKNIYSLLKLNLYLLIKKLQIYYGEGYVLQNEMYFKTFNYLLSRNGYNNMNENDIAEVIQNNCYNIVQSLSEIISYYETIGNIYYFDFLDLFHIISKLTEKEINNYFYNYLYSSRAGGQPPRPKNEYHPPPSRMRNGLRNNFYINNQIINNYNNININTLNNITNTNDINNINKRINMNILNNSFKNNNNNINNSNLSQQYQKNKISPPFLKNPSTKKYTLVLDLSDTLANIQFTDNSGQNIIFNLRPGLFSFLNAIKPIYELVSFTTESKEFSDMILKEIEKNRKYFDYNLYRDHATLYGNIFIKDITKLGRDIRKIIIVDDDPTNFKLNPENGIQISPYLGDSTKDDTTLFELKKLLILFEKNGGDDIRKVIKSYEKDIKEKISLNYNSKRF